MVCGNHACWAAVFGNNIRRDVTVYLEDGVEVETYKQNLNLGEPGYNSLLYKLCKEFIKHTQFSHTKSEFKKLCSQNGCHGLSTFMDIETFDPSKDVVHETLHLILNCFGYEPSKKWLGSRSTIR